MISHKENRKLIRYRLCGDKRLSGVDLVKDAVRSEAGMTETLKIMIAEGEVLKTENGFYYLAPNLSLNLKIGEIPTQAELDILLKRFPNWIIAIGYLSNMKCYFNMSIKEAIERYESYNDGPVDASVSVTIIGFHDHFEAYDLG